MIKITEENFTEIAQDWAQENPDICISFYASVRKAKDFYYFSSSRYRAYFEHIEKKPLFEILEVWVNKKPKDKKMIKITKENFTHYALKWAKKHSQDPVHFQGSFIEKVRPAIGWSYTSDYKAYSDHIYGTALWEILEVWVNEEQEAKEEIAFVTEENFKSVAIEWAKENPKHLINYNGAAVILSDMKAEDNSFRGEPTSYFDCKTGKPLIETLNAWINKPTLHKPKEEKMELIIGNKYTPHDKTSAYPGLENSNTWNTYGGKQQGFLYYKGFDGTYHTFGANKEDDSGDYFNPSDVIPYAEPKVELIVGNKYVPHDKTVLGYGNGLGSSASWEFGGKKQGFLYYNGANGEHHSFGVDLNSCGDFFNPSDVTPYVEPKAEVPITKVEDLLDVWVWDDNEKDIRVGKLMMVLDKGTFPVRVIMSNRQTYTGFKHYSLTNPTPMRPLTIDEISEIYWNCRGTFRYRNWAGGVIVTDPRLSYSEAEKDSEYSTDEGKTWQKCEKKVT